MIYHSNMEKPVIYVAGAITKAPGLNKQKFALATKQLRALGYIVINPHELCDGLPPEEWKKCMRITIAKMVSDAEIIVMLDDWQESRGATIEVNIARSIEIKTVNLIDFLNEPEKYHLSKAG
ncbi:hypothetical protein D3C87_720040 [compost metagenome]